jgi:uncharacterized protein YjbI with pentapeptide repeats
VKQERTRHERTLDLVRSLVGVEPGWQPARQHYLWAIRIAVAASLTVIVLALVGRSLWRVLFEYIDPATPTERKDLANIFVLIVAGVVGTLTALAAVGNLYISRRNLQNARATLHQQRELDERRAQDDALQSYFEQIGDLLTEHQLKRQNPDDDVSDVSRLARAQTFTVLGRLSAKRKRDLLLFIHGAGLIDKYKAIVVLAGADLTEADLSGANLREANLSGADLIHADLREANLSGANLREANLREADLRQAYFREIREVDLMGANLIRADLREADLSGNGANLVNAYLHEANLSGAHLRKANLSGAHLHEANLSGARLHEANLISASLRGANLIRAYLSKADIRGADLHEANLSSADLSDASLRETDLTAADLTKANLSGAYLGAANLQIADLSKANLSGAYLREVSFCGADLSGARLRVSDLTAADLSEANLSGADLSVANLTAANLRGAILPKADLSGARGWTVEQLAAVQTLKGAIMPNGQKYEDWIKSRGRREDREYNGPS